MKLICRIFGHWWLRRGCLGMRLEGVFGKTWKQCLWCKAKAFHETHHGWPPIRQPCPPMPRSFPPPRKPTRDEVNARAIGRWPR